MIIKTTIRGLSPLILNRFTEDAEIAVSSGTRVSIKANGELPRDVAEKKLYKDSKTGALYIPGDMIFASIIAAGSFHKVQNRRLTTAKASLIPAGLMIVETICPLKCKGWEVDSRSVVIPKTGGRIMAHRPRIDEWECSFSLDIDELMFNEKTARILVDDAGKKTGLGDFRPSRKGPFGRFSVIEWKISK